VEGVEMKGVESGWSRHTCQLHNGITDSLFRRLQSVQNAAARFISGARRSDHITPVLRQLHWLPVRQRVQCVQVIAGAHTPVPFQRVPAYHSRWPPGAAFRGCHHLPRTTHPD